MDLASTLRVLTRHPILVSVLLLMTLAGTAAALNSAAQTHQATGSYLLLGAKTPPKAADGTEVATDNPFSTMELSTVVDILVRAETTEQVAQELESNGFVGSFAVEGNKDFNRGPVIDLTATSPTAEQALAGYELLATDVQEELKDRQLSEGANPAYLLGMQRLQEPVVTTPGLVSRLRISIAIFAVGIIVTIGLTLAVDSLQKSRRARKLAMQETATEPDDATTSPHEADRNESADPSTSESDTDRAESAGPGASVDEQQDDNAPHDSAGVGRNGDRVDAAARDASAHAES